jgi:hypothetical protein
MLRKNIEPLDHFLCMIGSDGIDLLGLGLSVRRHEKNGEREENESFHTVKITENRIAGQRKRADCAARAFQRSRRCPLAWEFAPSSRAESVRNVHCAWYDHAEAGVQRLA